MPRPKISVGLMVYNEQRYVARALDSLLSQDANDFEIVIADNGSTDNSSVIASEYANRHANIRYIRHAENIGSNKNIQFLIDEAAGDYFVLAAGHDLWSSNYLSRLCNLLDENSDAVLAYGTTSWIDDTDGEMHIPCGFIDTRSVGSTTRFHLALWWTDHYCSYGMIRLSALRRTHFRMPSIATETLVLAQLALEGPFLFAQDATWHCRQNRRPESIDERMDRYYRDIFERPRVPLMPIWCIPFSLMRFAITDQSARGNRVVLFCSALSTFVLFRYELWWDLKSLPRRLKKLLLGTSEDSTSTAPIVSPTVKCES